MGINEMSDNCNCGENLSTNEMKRRELSTKGLSCAKVSPGFVPRLTHNCMRRTWPPAIVALPVVRFVF
jgi:hypothetical protein